MATWQEQDLLDQRWGGSDTDSLQAQHDLNVGWGHTIADPNTGNGSDRWIDIERLNISPTDPKYTGKIQSHGGKYYIPSSAYLAANPQINKADFMTMMPVYAALALGTAGAASALGGGGAAGALPGGLTEAGMLAEQGGMGIGAVGGGGAGGAVGGSSIASQIMSGALPGVGDAGGIVAGASSPSIVSTVGGLLAPSGGANSIWGNVLGQGISAILGANAAGKAADAQLDATGQAIGEQRRQYDQTRTDNEPFRVTGTLANERLRTLLGLAPGEGSGDLTRKFTMADRDADPVYQSGLDFGRKTGEDAINARAVGMGNYDSGATLKALTTFGNDYGSTKANDSYNRFTNDQNNIYNRLTGTSGGGQVATNAVSAAGSNMANNVSNSLTDAGNARAASVVGGANAVSGAIGNVSKAYENQQTNDILRRILAGRGY